LDYTINLGSKNIVDQDQRKLLRTFLIAYAVLLQGKELKRESNQIVLIGDESQEKHLKIFKSSPHYLFKIMRTDNEKINSIIQHYANNPEVAKHYFTFDYIFRPIDSVIQGQIHKIQDVVAIAARNASSAKKTPIKQESPNAVEPIASANLAIENSVHLFFRISNEEIIADDEIVKIFDEHVNFHNHKLYVQGDWFSVNQLNVSQQILTMIKQKIYPMWQEENRQNKNKQFQIHISLTEKCRLEKEVLPSMIQLIEKDISAFGKVSLELSPENRKKISQSAGFHILENHILNYK